MQVKSVFLFLRQNIFSLLAVGYIVFLCILALFAESFVTDTSENSNQMHLAIHSKPPGFTVEVLQVFDQDYNMIDEIPLSRTRWNAQVLEYQPYGMQGDYFKPIPLQLYPEGTTFDEVATHYILKKKFWLGTDKYGRDVLSRIIMGSRISLSIGFIAVFIALLIGVFLGAIAGFYGGILDRIIYGLINIIWSIPSLLVIIGLTLALGKGYWQVFVAVGFTMWVDVARMVRGQVLSLKEKSHVHAARVLGFSSLRILIKHILPRVVPALIVLSAANFASAILIESGLSFLGIGAQPPTPSWGGMIKDHFRFILLGKAYLALIPGFAIMSLVLAFMVLGNALRDALDVNM